MSRSAVRRSAERRTSPGASTRLSIRGEGGQPCRSANGEHPRQTRQQLLPGMSPGDAEKTLQRVWNLREVGSRDQGLACLPNTTDVCCSCF